VNDDDWARRRVLQVLGGLVAEARPILDANLRGLTDEEYHWEPAPGSWAVRRRDDVRTPDCWGKGDWVVETSFDGRVQPTTTTIGWRLMHAYDCTNDFTSRAFGRGPCDWNDVDVAGTAAEAVALMTAALDRLEADLAGDDDGVLLGELDPQFRKPRWRLLDKALLEAIAHVSEIGVLRTVHRLRSV
jgi:hypothetical protein